MAWVTLYLLLGPLSAFSPSLDSPLLVGLPYINKNLLPAHDILSSVAIWVYAAASAAGFASFGLYFDEEAGAATAMDSLVLASFRDRNKSELPRCGFGVIGLIMLPLERSLLGGLFSLFGRLLLCASCSCSLRCSGFQVGWSCIDPFENTLANLT